MKKLSAIVLAGFVLASPLAAAAPADAPAEKLTYAWRLKGGLSWLARLAFPSSGRGTLETNAAGNVHSRLTISADDSKGYYLYESMMAPTGTQTLTSRSAYAYGDSRRDERVAFDVPNGVAHVQKTTNEGSESKTHKLESATPQDVLTSIYYLRQHADEIRSPKQAKLFSGAKGYDILFQPQPTTMMRVGGANLRVRPFTLEPVGNDAKRFPGEVHVWLSDDARHLPVRIDIEQKYATLKLDLQQ
ncbi:MAG TPA: DUF3108 domain-containing protein [Thermoanaerobaculia bacterium]|nr:DUF3108 domain-containing protein [Thermoanaerobaculia bacterium]